MFSSISIIAQTVRSGQQAIHLTLRLITTTTQAQLLPLIITVMSPPEYSAQERAFPHRSSQTHSIPEQTMIISISQISATTLPITIRSTLTITAVQTVNILHGRVSGQAQATMPRLSILIMTTIGCICSNCRQSVTDNTPM